MIVIFHHPADRNVQVKLIQHLQSHIDLTFSAVHQDQIRKHGKFAELGILLAFPESMSKSSGENLSQASVIVSSLDSLDLKLPIVISLRFPRSYTTIEPTDSNPFVLEISYASILVMPSIPNREAISFTAPIVLPSSRFSRSLSLVSTSLAFSAASSTSFSFVPFWVS